MNCLRCHRPIPENVKFCPACGNPVPQTSDAVNYVVPLTTSWVAVVASYLGLFSLLPIFAPFAIIVGIIALGDCKKRNLPGKGRAIFAIVMGGIVTSLCAVCIVAAVLTS